MIRAITVWQPWADEILTGRKTVENRLWTTDYRGPLAIHTGRRHAPGHGHLANAGVLGVVQLVDVHDSEHCDCHELLGATKRDTFEVPGQVSPYLFHLVMINPRRLTEPIPAPGRQMLWTPNDELAERIRNGLTF